MDDSKSDNTDDLLTSIEPLIHQSDFLVHEEGYKNNKWVRNRTINGFHSNMPVIVDDILSSRSAFSEEWKDKRVFQSPSIANIASHNSRQQEEFLNSERPNSSHIYEASISSQTTPRNMSANRQLLHIVDKSDPSQQWGHYKKLVEHSIARCDIQLHGDLDDGHLALNNSRTEIQRLQLNNKQLSTQLHEAKLSIQTLSVQLEQVQQESLHKENTMANLDNTLGKLVSGWKKREGQKDQDIYSMQQHIDSKERIIEECQRMAEETKRALTNADKAVQMEKNRLEQLQKSASVEIQNLKNDRTIAMRVNQELTNRCTGLESEIKRLNDLYSEKVKSIDVLNYQTKEDYTLWQRENENLKRDIDRMKEEALTLQFEVQCREDKLCQMKTEMKLLEEEVHRIRRERDDKSNSLSDLRNNAKKMQDEHIVAMKRQEKELLNQWHQDLNKRLQDSQDQQKRTVQTLQNNMQGKLNEQSKRHRLELERLRHVAEQEIASRMSDSEETVSMLRERLERSEKSVQFWQQEKEVVERARNQISSQLYDLMKSGYQPDCAQVSETKSSALVKNLVKPSFVPPKNQNLLQTMPNNFFEPIKSDSSITITTVNSSRNGHNLSDRSQVLLSTNGASLYY